MRDAAVHEAEDDILGPRPKVRPGKRCILGAGSARFARQHAAQREPAEPEEGRNQQGAVALQNGSFLNFCGLDTTSYNGTPGGRGDTLTPDKKRGKPR